MADNEMTYKINKANATPRVRFMYRVNKTINIAAEKTTEKALQQAVQRTSEELGFDLSDFTVYPEPKTMPPRYEFLIQPTMPVENISLELLSETLNRHMCDANEFYRVCLAEHSMQDAVAYWLQPESTFLWRELQIAKGKSASQLKPVRVISNEDQKRFFYILRDNIG